MPSRTMYSRNLSGSTVFCSMTSNLRQSLAPVSLVLAVSLSGCVSGNRTDPGTAHYPALPGSGITVYAAGDIADCRKIAPAETAAARTADLVAAGLAADSTAVVLTLGDNVYQSGTASEHTNCYAPTWGRFKARTLPSPGNHEYYSKDAAGYYDYFGTGAGPDRRGYYSVDIGGWHVVSLNSNLKGAAQQAQVDWLKADLTAHPATCTLAYWHHPVFSSGGHGNDDRMREVWQLLAAAGTELILSAHDHDYERFAPQDAHGQYDAAHGTRQFVVGTGGAELSPFRLLRNHSETADNDTYGVLKLHLKSTGYEWDFMPVGGGTYRDHGSARCH
ncbi:metallophosphoesterase family protein [Actimicrobium antarcticum]|uniref:Calcineurin-like phosphoesterase domain-containing protein n=1 Tax=Actimicrobium antarcticum TaxID=1051899 RepID=A0ABP7TEL7_9BURK